MSKFSNYHLSIVNSNKVILNIIKFVVEKSDSLLSVINYPTNQPQRSNTIDYLTTNYPMTRQQRKLSSASSTTSSQNILGPILNELHQQLVKNESSKLLLQHQQPSTSLLQPVYQQLPSTSSFSNKDYSNIPKNRYRKLFTSAPNNPPLVLPAVAQVDVQEEGVLVGEEENDDEQEFNINIESNEKNQTNLEESKMPRGEFIGTIQRKKAQKRRHSSSSTSSYEKATSPKP